MNAAAPEDTVFVRVGAGRTARPSRLSRDIVLLGDPTAYHAGGNDPTKLPLVVARHRHGWESSANTSARVILIRTLAIGIRSTARHLHARRDVAISNVYVNPTSDPFNSGRGIYIDSTNTASVDSSKVQTIKGFGDLLHNVTNGSVTRSQAFLGPQCRRTAPTSTGIEVDYGANNLVSGNMVRWTYGPEVLLDSTASVVATGNSLAGGGQLMRVLGVTGASQVISNAFNTLAQNNDLNPGSSASDGRSGLELNMSSGVQVTGNTIKGDTGTVALVDAIRLIGTRGGSSPTLIQGNPIAGGRYGIRSENSTWTLQLSRVHGGSVGCGAVRRRHSQSDIRHVDDRSDRLRAGEREQHSDRGDRRLVQSVRPDRYGGSVRQRARCGGRCESGTRRSLAPINARLRLPEPTTPSSSGNTMAGAAPEGAVTASTLLGVVDLQADSVTAVGNAVTGYPSYAALSLAGTTVRADSNFLSRNRVGIAMGCSGGVRGTHERHFDNDTAGVVNEQAAGVSMPSNWWGDSLGPRGVGVRMAVGDSVVGNVSFQPVDFIPLNAGFRAAPPLRSIRGNGQSATQGTALPLPLAVRVVDPAGRPVAGVAITFETSGGASLNGGGSSTVQTTNSSGLGEVLVTLGGPGTYTVAASGAGEGSVTFTETATP